MKTYSFILLSASVLLITGCTHNLIKSDYKTEKQYYDDLNNTAEGRTARITVKDSTFSSEEINISENSLTGKIIWREYPYYFNLHEKQYAIPAEDVRSISFTKRTYSIIKGMGIGFAAGAVWGGMFIDLGGSSNSGHHSDYVSGAVVSSLAGAVIGGLVGIFVGDDYVFSFDEKLTRQELFDDNSAHKFGLKLGYHNGFKFFNTSVGGSGAGAKIGGEGKQGIVVTLFYNLSLGKNFSLNNEFSFVSASSKRNYAVWILSPDRTYYLYEPIYGSSVDNINLIEAAPLIRLNLFKKGFTPYLILGPKFGIQLIGNSLKENFYSDINKQYGGDDFRISGKYNTFIWGGVAGAGISTGKLFPYEILIEIRYCMDVLNRFIVNSYSPGLNEYPYYYDNLYRQTGQRSNELIISIGAALY